MLLTVDLPPGLYKNGTEYSSKGRFYECSLWRWFEGTQRPVGGWRSKSAALDGKARSLIAWQANDNTTYAAIGTNTKLYAMNRTGVLTDITPVGFIAGAADAVSGGGYGFGLYGAGSYGVPTADSESVVPAAVWSLDTFGENLLGCFAETVYQWVPGDPQAVVLINAPSAESVLVTEERVVFAIASDGDPRAVDWSDAEDNTDWTPTSTNLAGGKRLQTSGRLVTGRRVRGGNLIFSDAEVFVAEFVGLPFVYRFDRLGSGCGVPSKGAPVAVDDRAFWPGVNSFWQYNGGVLPLESDVSEFFYRNLNVSQRSKISGWHNSAFGEVWWHYPSASSVECDRVVIYNYREDHWNEMAWDRLAGVDKGVFTYPLLTREAVYEHEVGQNRGGVLPYAQTGPLELGNGDRTMNMDCIIPDDLALGDVTVSLTTGDWTMDPDVVFGPYTATAKTDVRLEERRVALRFEASPDRDFRLGKYRFNVTPGSERGGSSPVAVPDVGGDYYTPGAIS